MQTQGSGKQALITGASSGIGAAFARQLASGGYDLALVARRTERLMALASELRLQHNVAVQIMVADLSNAAGVGRVESYIADLPRLDILINNAGFIAAGKFAEVGLSRQLDMIHVHVVAGSHLTRVALPGMIARGEGAVINVSSLAALMPTSANPTYCATKAYLLTLTEALHSELQGTGVKVQVLLPGLTYTEFYTSPESAEFDYSRMPKAMWMSADKVVAASLAALRKGRVICIPGLTNRLIATLARSGLTSLLWKMVALRLRTWLPRLLPIRPATSAPLHSPPASRSFPAQPSPAPVHAALGGAEAQEAISGARPTEDLSEPGSLTERTVPPDSLLLAAALLPAPSSPTPPSPDPGGGIPLAD